MVKVGKLETETVKNGNTADPAEKVVLVPTTKKLRVEYLNFSSKRRTVIFVVPQADGSVKDKERKIHYKLDYKLLWDGGGTAYVDENRGIQVEPMPDGDWRGISGAETFEWDWGKIFNAIASLKSTEMLKWAKIGVMMSGIIVLLIVGLLIFGPQLFNPSG